jgi:hypothetical protein
MPLPTDDLIVWASSDVNLPNLAGPNKVKPIDDLILKGWDFKQKPAADEFNYVLNNLGMHVSYLEESKTYTFSGDVTGSVVSSGSEDFSVNLQVVDNSHNHTSANISDATSANNSNTVVKRGASGEISVGDLTISKVGGVSTINFPATSNDAGYIKHSETNDVSKIQFSISDNNDSNDKVEFGNTQGGSFTPTFTITSTGVATGSNGQLHSVSVLTGTISHGGTIPLPSGYSEGQCRWMVSMNNDNPSNTAWDWQEGVSSDHIHSYCSSNGTRVVTCYRTVINETGSQTHNGTANYIIIGVK